MWGVSGFRALSLTQAILDSTVERIGCADPTARADDEEVSAVHLFQRKKDTGVQSFMLRLLNANCPELQATLQGPRLERRVNLAIVVLVVPIENDALNVKRAFATITKDFSSTGVALILNQPHGLNEVVMGFRWSGSITWIRGKAKHLTPMGGGFYQLGFRLTEKLASGDFPELDAVEF